MTRVGDTMTWPAATGAALFSALGRPTWWALALAGFLVRGGFLLLLLPLVELPSLAGLATLFGPLITDLVLGGDPVEVVVVVAAIVLGGISLVVGSTIVGAALEQRLVVEAASDEELEGRPPPVSPSLGRITAARLIAHVPTVLVLAVAAVRIGEAGYLELIGPGDGRVPVLLRVVARAPEAVAALVLVWLAGEAAGGVAVRRLAAEAGLGFAMREGARGVLRAAGLATLAVTTLVVGATVLLAAGAAGLAFGAARYAVIAGSPLEAFVSVLLLSLVWVAGLWLLSLATAWRATAWTFEALRRR